MSKHRPAFGLLSLERRDLLLIAGIWAVWTAATLLFASLAMTLPTNTQAQWEPAVMASAPPLARWDAGWYHEVARAGYHFQSSSPTSDVRFYPLYPIAMRVVAGLTGWSLFTSGTAVSVLCLLPALLLLADLVRRERGADAIVPALAALLFFPTSFYFAAVYSESMFLLATVAAFWAARQSQWLLAGIAGAAASLTRLNGMLILLPLLYLAWLELRRDPPQVLRPVSGLGLAIAGAAAYPAYLWVRFGSPLVYFRVGDAGWPHRPTPPWVTARRVGSELLARLSRSDGGSVLFFLALASAVLFGILSIVLMIRGPLDYGLYMIATMLLLSSSGSLDALPRYVLPLFPGFILIGIAFRRSAWLLFAYSLTGLGLYGILLHRFVHWLWVA